MPFARLARKLIQPFTEMDEPEGAQFGALPYRIVEGKVVFLMITSRRSANWVFPKGSEIKGLKPWETAAQEALEEAGIRGEIEHEPVGFYLHPRNRDPNELVEVNLFPMLVTEQHDTWPEEHQRFRHWALLPETRRLLASKDAAKLAVTLNRRILFGYDVEAQGNARISA